MLTCNMYKQWRIQEFQNRGAGRSRGCRILEFLGSGDCIEAHSQILFVFVVNVEIKIHAVHTACFIQLKYRRIKLSTFAKTTQENFF